MKQKPVTIKEIARRLNVSVSTISRALHDHPSIGLAMRQQVQQLARELKYEPNQAAISFKQGKTFTIGVILPNLSEEFFSMAINGIEDVATVNKYTVLIGQSHDDTAREKLITDTMRKHRIDGLIVSLAKDTTSYEHFDQVMEQGIPVVFFDRVPDLPGFFTVSCNLRDSSVKLVDWLISRGHTRIGFIKGPETLKPSLERLEGYCEALRKNNLPVREELISQTDLNQSSTQQAVRQLLALADRPTAIIAFNDYVALEAIRYARSAGVKVNKDIFFVSYANLPVTSYLDEPPIASVEQFPYQQAEKATELLFSLISAKGLQDEFVQKHVLESKIIVNKEI